MRIGIDISQIVYGTGVSFYTRNLVKALARLDRKNKYILFGGSLRRKQALRTFVQDIEKINKNFSSKIIFLPPAAADFLWNRLHVWPVEKWIGKVDVFHASNWTQPPTRAATVTTIHDLYFLRHPELSHPKLLAVHKRQLEWVKKEVGLVIAVSKATKQDVVDLLGIAADKIRVIYEAAPKEFKKAGKDKVEGVRKKYKIKGDFILAVATREPRKNLKRTVAAFRSLKRKNLQLVIAGKVGFGEDVKPEEGIILAGYVPHEDLAALYSGARCLVYPSLYEGFGQPVLEAFVCGCPVITSRVSSLPEVGGKAAVYVDPYNVNDIAQGILEVLCFDAMTHQSRVEAGLKQAEKFSWEKCARETLEVYEEAVQSGKIKRR